MKRSDHLDTKVNAETSLLASIVRSSNDAIIGKTLEGIITSWNPAAERIFGYAASETIGKSLLVIFPPDRISEEADILTRISRGETVQHFETVRVRKDGTTIDISATISPIKNADGRVVGVSKIARDITLLKVHERETTRLTRLYAALSGVNHAIVVSQNRAQLFTAACRALVEAGKFHMAWIGWLDRETRMIIPAGQWGDSVNYLSQVAFQAGGPPEDLGPNGIAIRDGKRYVCNSFKDDPSTILRQDAAILAGIRAAAAFPIRQGGEVCGALSVYSDEIGFFKDKEIALLEEAAGDVSFGIDSFDREASRRQAEAALRESEERFREMAVNISEVFWMTDTAKNEILYISPAYEGIWGRRCEDLYRSPQTWLEAIVPEDRERILAAVTTSR